MLKKRRRWVDNDLSRGRAQGPRVSSGPRVSPGKRRPCQRGPPVRLRNPSQPGNVVLTELLELARDARGLFATTIVPLSTPAQHTLKAGAAYFAIVFAVGFALGTVRTLFIAPRLGEQLAVVIELPLMLGASWLACGWVVRRWHVAAAAGPRLTMGAVAFALLMIAEITLSLTAFDRSFAVYVRSLVTPHGITGLLGQVVFALMPVLHRRR